MVDGHVDLLEHGRQFVLARAHLVVAGAHGDAQLVAFRFHIAHVGVDALGNGAEIVIFQLLAFGRVLAEQGAAGQDEVGPGVVECLVDEEVFLFPAEGRNDARDVLVKKLAHRNGRLVEIGLRLEERQFLVERFAGVGDEDRRDTEGAAFADFQDEGRRGRIPVLVFLVATLGLWRWSQGSVSVNTVVTPKAEAYYWATITLSQTLGTALGDWLADTGGLGYDGGALVFGAALAIVAGLYYWTSMSRVALFWLAFILTRPLGATVGDFLDKPVAEGGLDLSRPVASAVLAAIIIVLLIVLPQRRDSTPATTIRVRPPMTPLRP